MYSKKRVAAYCRVSTDFEDQLHSLSTQRAYFNEYISEHEEWELVNIYYDEGITGTSTKKRDGFNRMIKDCEKGKIDTILTKEVSRFARNTVDTLNYTRHLKELKINVIFMNDGINTNDKDGELRLTIMASLAQEESRKTSERVKWGIRRKMEQGFVYGKSHMLGYNIIDGKLEVIPEEAEIIKKIFHMYVFEGKGSGRIANTLNAAGYTSSTGAIFRQDSIMTILKNEKYCGDLVQWKTYSTDFLSKKVVKNTGDNPDTPLIVQKDHHEPIISREVFEAAQVILEKRGKKSKDGRLYSQHYWHSSRIYCGECGSAFGITGSKENKNRCLRCVNRAKYGKEKKVNVNGVIVGCENKFITERLINTCMKYVLEYVRNERDGIAEELISEVNYIRANAVAIDIKPLQEKIDSILKKKHKAIDLMLEGIITKEDLKAQVDIYDAEIKKLSTQITHNTNLSETHKEQLNEMKNYLSQIDKAENIDTDSFQVYNSMLKKIVVFNDGTIDYYLNCIPFGFHLTYRKEQIPHSYHKTGYIVEKCEMIS